MFEKTLGQHVRKTNETLGTTYIYVLLICFYNRNVN